MLNAKKQLPYEAISQKTAESRRLFNYHLSRGRRVVPLEYLQVDGEY
jgi:hypothetical protein